MISLLILYGNLKVGSRFPIKMTRNMASYFGKLGWIINVQIIMRVTRTHMAPGTLESTHKSLNFR